jgi:hypothetical protein
MATPRRRPRSADAGAPTPRREEPTPRKKAERPKGPPSIIVNLRLPLELLARLDRYIDPLTRQIHPTKNAWVTLLFLSCIVVSYINLTFPCEDLKLYSCSLLAYTR